MKWKKRFGTVVMTSWLLSFLFCMILCGWECIRGDRGDLENCTDTDSGSR